MHSTVHSFVFSPIQENTYIISDPSGDAVVIDPGMLFQHEKEEFRDFVKSKNFTISYLLQTHAHLDHVFGSAFIKRTYGVQMWMHELEVPILADFENRCQMWGIPGCEPVEADAFLNEGDVIEFGNTRLEVVHVPGHAPGHVAFINHADRYVIGGDCLFKNSIGRTDLPLSNHADLIRSIQTKFFTLPDDYTVYAGHMEPTTIGYEKRTNPFVR